MLEPKRGSSRKKGDIRGHAENLEKIFSRIGSGSMLLLAGCASTYYKVWDPVSRNAYYTDRVDSVGGGAVKLKDARTGNTVTLQNSEVKEISKRSL